MVIARVRHAGRRRRLRLDRLHPAQPRQHSPGVGANMWVIGLVISGLGTILGAVNMITTILTLRAPGMTMFRMPIFTWNILITSLMVIMVFPLLAAALLALMADRLLGAHVYDAGHRRPACCGSTCSGSSAIPRSTSSRCRSSASSPRSSRSSPASRSSATRAWSRATIAIAALSMSVWAHHMFATGQVLLPFFSFLSFLIAVPTGMKFFNWIGTMWRGQLSFETPMLFAIGFLVTFLFGGLTGVLLASPPVDFHVSDTYFVVAHFHYVLFGTIVFAVFAGIYFWFPKMFGRMLDERLGKVHFWLTFIGFHTTFLVQHWLGNEGMPRRYADYLPTDGFTDAQHGLDDRLVHPRRLHAAVPLQRVEVLPGRPGGRASTTRGATATRWSGRPRCPPPLRNFDRMPRIRSERPAFDAKFPHLAAGLGWPGRPRAAPNRSPAKRGAAPATKKTPWANWTESLPRFPNGIVQGVGHNALEAPHPRHTKPPTGGQRHGRSILVIQLLLPTSTATRAAIRPITNVPDRSSRSPAPSRPRRIPTARFTASLGTPLMPGYAEPARAADSFTTKGGRWRLSQARRQAVEGRPRATGVAQCRTVRRLCQAAGRPQWTEDTRDASADRRQENRCAGPSRTDRVGTVKECAECMPTVVQHGGAVRA